MLSENVVLIADPRVVQVISPQAKEYRKIMGEALSKVGFVTSD